jgi:ribosomal protein S18 acetylase RimI-like enzyme
MGKFPKGYTYIVTYLDYCSGISVDIHCDEGAGVAHFNYDSLNAAPGLIHSHSAWIHPDYRGKGIGRLLRELKDDCVKQYNGGIILCTVHQANAKQIHLLETCGWKRMFSYTNYKKCNHIYLYVKLGHNTVDWTDPEKLQGK